MEYLGWECSPNVSSWWSNQQCEIRDLSDSNCCGYKTEDDILNPIQQLMIHKRTSVGDDYPINSEKLVSQLMVQHLAVPPVLDSIIVASTINYSRQHEHKQRQLEAIRLASANNMILVSESGAACTSWESEADLCNSNSPNSIKMMPDFGIMPQDIKAAAVFSTITTTASMDSVDCLLSATNSNTDTTISAHQDDGINSVLFSQSHSKNSVLSGDSGKGDDHKHLYHEIRPNSSSNKRSNNNIDQCQLFRGGEYCSNKGGRFQLISGNDHPPEAKKARLLENKLPSSSNINFQQPSSCNLSANYVDDHEPDSEAIAQMKEMIYRAAAFRPVNLGEEEEVVEKPRRKNVKVSSDPQTVAARQRRERISKKIRVLQRLVPGGTKMDTASMLDEAASYLKFLRSQVKALETLGQGHTNKLDSFVNSSSFPFNH